jgi:hypothetical protein
VLAASGERQVSIEQGGHGAFTRLLLEGLEGAAADLLGNVTPLSVYAALSPAFGAWEQRPVFKSYVSQTSPLRTCRPSIEPELVRQLPKFFGRPDERVRLSPEHEGTRPIPNGSTPTAQQQAFDDFKRLRNAGLLTTDDAKDLYFVALDSEDVYLTPLGRSWWRLAAEKKL